MDDLKFPIGIIMFVVIFWVSGAILGKLLNLPETDGWVHVGDKGSVHVYCDPWNNRVYLSKTLGTQDVAVVRGDCR